MNSTGDIEVRCPSMPVIFLLFTPMLTYFLFAIGFLLLIKGADFLVEGSAAIAKRMHISSIVIGLTVVAPETRVIEHANATAAVMFGATVDQIIGHRCHAFLCPAQEGACPVCDLGKDVDNSERWMVCADGRHRPVLKTVKKIKIHGSEKLLECFVDITERKKIETALQASEDRFRSMVESLPDPYSEINLEGAITFVNEAFVHETGYSRDELMGKKFNPDFPLENNYVQVLHHGGPDALAHKPQNQARFFLGTDNSK